MGAFLFGKDAVLYQSDTALDGSTNTAASLDTGGSWTEYDNVMDVTGNFTGVKVPTDTRATAKLGWTSEETVLKQGNITLTIPQKSTADATFNKFRDAWLNGTLITIVALNQAMSVTGAQGLAANFSVEMTQGQPLQEKQTWDVTLTVASFPEWYEVS